MLSESNRPGLWRDPAAPANAPGLYALIVGASRYPFLSGGEHAQQKTYGMGQLVSSARTAATVFQWLRSEFRRKDLPPISCHLLLAPTADEKQWLDQVGLRHYVEPTETNMRNALLEWAASLPNEPASAARSRSFFFFSGHGVSTNWSPLLVPSDYLDPRFGPDALQRGFDADEMKTWMETHRVGEHFAAFDACRNELAALASVGGRANRVFRPNPPGPISSRVVASIAATLPNSAAFQLKNDDHTVFGQAFIEGLRGAGRRGPTDTEVEFQSLVMHVNQRVEELMKDHPVRQVARPSLEPAFQPVVVTELLTPATSAGHESLSLEKMVGLRSGGAHDRASVGGAIAEAFAKWSRSKLDITAREALTRAKHTEHVFQKTLQTRSYGDFALDALRRDANLAHKKLGHEYAVAIWASSKLLPLSPSQPQDDVASEARVWRVWRDETSETVQISLEMPCLAGGALLVLGDDPHAVERCLAVPLPTDARQPVPVRLTLHTALNVEGTPRLYRIEAQLDPEPESENEHYVYLAELAQIARSSTFGIAAHYADPKRLFRAMGGRDPKVTVALAGALLLARGGRIADAGDRTKTLFKVARDLPDSAVLWAESLRHAVDAGASFGVDDPVDAIVAALDASCKAGIPFFAETVEVMNSVFLFLRRREEALMTAQIAVLRSVEAHLEMLRTRTSPAGQFLQVSGATFGGAVSSSATAAGTMLDLFRPSADRAGALNVAADHRGGLARN